MIVLNYTVPEPSEADKKLDALVAKDKRIARLRTIPQVGARLAELVVTMLDDPAAKWRGSRTRGRPGAGHSGRPRS